MAYGDSYALLGKPRKDAKRCTEVLEVTQRDAMMNYGYDKWMVSTTLDHRESFWMYGESLYGAAVPRPSALVPRPSSLFEILVKQLKH